MMTPIDTAARDLEALATACFSALGPASHWGYMARGNADAIRRDGTTHQEWLRNRANDWLEFAAKTDPDLAELAIKAAGSMAALVDGDKVTQVRVEVVGEVEAS